MSILITGGAGYIGRHTAKLLDESGLDVVILDNRITGRHENLRWGALIEADIANVGMVRSIIRRHAFTARRVEGCNQIVRREGARPIQKHQGLG